MGAELEGPRHLAVRPLTAAPALAALAAAAAVAATTVTPVKVGIAPCAELGAYGALWVANGGSSTLSRVDPATGKTTGVVHVGAEPCTLAAGAGSLWVDGYGTNAVERVDPRRLRRTKAIPVGPGVWDVAFDGRHVWADANGNGTVVEIDPLTNRIVARIHTGGSPAGLAVAFGSLWVGTNGASDTRFFRISLASHTVTTVRPGCTRPAFFATSGSAAPWVTCVGDGVAPGAAERVDPATNTVTARVTVGRNPGDGALGPNGDVWVPNKLDGTVTRVDASTARVIETVHVGGTPFVVAAAFGDIWVPDATGATVSRLRTGS